MKLIGAEEALATGTTKLNDTAHYVFSILVLLALVTIRNADDDGDTGSVRINANAGCNNHLILEKDCVEHPLSKVHQ